MRRSNIYTLPQQQQRLFMNQHLIQTKIIQNFNHTISQNIKCHHSCKSYIGNARKIRHSPWKMNRICQFAAQTKTVPEALIQLQFLNKRYAQNLHHAIRRTSNFADIKDGIQPSQLEVAECFATCGFRRKGITYHGKGKCVYLICCIRRLLLYILTLFVLSSCIKSTNA